VRHNKHLPIGILSVLFALAGLATLIVTTTPSASAETSPTKKDYQVPKDDPTSAPPANCPTGPDQGRPAPGNDIGNCSKYAPYDHPLDDPYDRTETAKVVAWGEVATNKDGTATLVAKQAVAGPIADTQQVTFDLCAIKEIRLPDTGMVDILQLMANEPKATTPTVPGEDYYNSHYPTGDILIDNTSTIVHGETDGFLSRYLPAGACANVTVVSPNRDMETAYLGFTSYDTSSGVHIEGEFTRIAPGGAVSILAHEP